MITQRNLQFSLRGCLCIFVVLSLFVVTSIRCYRYFEFSVAINDTIEGLCYDGSDMALDQANSIRNVLKQSTLKSIQKPVLAFVQRQTLQRNRGQTLVLDWVCDHFGASSVKCLLSNGESVFVPFTNAETMSYRFYFQTTIDFDTVLTEQDANVYLVSVSLAQGRSTVSNCFVVEEHRLEHQRPTRGVKILNRGFELIKYGNKNFAFESILSRSEAEFSQDFVFGTANAIQFSRSAQTSTVADL